jgi:hypothetical protein
MRKRLHDYNKTSLKYRRYETNIQCGISDHFWRKPDAEYLLGRQEQSVTTQDDNP